MMKTKRLVILLLLLVVSWCALNSFNKLLTFYSVTNDMQNQPLYEYAVVKTKTLDGAVNKLYEYSQKVTNDDIMQMKAHLPPLLPHYKSPCWLEEVPEDFSYEDGYFYKYACPGQQEMQTYIHMGEVLEERCNNNKNETCWRLRCFPYFFFLGPCKTGTSDLHTVLHNYLPEIALTGMRKESQFWPRRRFGVEFCGGNAKKTLYRKESATLADYLDFHDNAAEIIRQKSVAGYHKHIFGDYTPANYYLQHNWTSWTGNINEPEPKVILAHQLYNIRPETKFIINVREPIARLISNYYHLQIKEPMNDYFQALVINFRDCMESHPIRYCAYHEHQMPDILAIGMYYIFLKDWLDVFPSDQIYVFVLENYNKEPAKIVNEIGDFLGTAPLSAGSVAKLENRDHSVRHLNREKPSGYTNKILQDFYREWNHKLADLLQNPQLTWGY